VPLRLVLIQSQIWESSIELQELRIRRLSTFHWDTCAGGQARDCRTFSVAAFLVKSVTAEPPLAILL
jgi:hypothetical protein